MKLGEIARESRETYSGDKTGIPIVGLEHLVSQELRFTDYDIDTENTFTKRFHKGQILFGRRRAYLKKAAIADFDGICSGDITVIEAIPGKVDPMLLPFIIQNDRLFDYAISHSAGGLSPRVKWADLADYEFDLPSLEEQRRLADKLWAAYELKEAYKKMIAATDEMVKAQFIEMFGDQNTNDKLWSESFVKDEFNLIMGKTPTRNNPECWEGGTHKWISISDMASYARYTGDTSEYITDFAITNSGIKIVPKGTIIMSFKLSIGRTAITSEDIYTNEAIMAFGGFDQKRFNIDFLHFLIANKNWQIGAKQAVKGKTLNKESIGNTKIIIPPIKLQEEFAKIYNQAEKSKSELRQAIEKIDRVMKSLMQ